MEFSCRICQVENCDVRQHRFEEAITWTIENVASDGKHQIDE